MTTDKPVWTWKELYAKWRWAQISDTAFITFATELGKESNAIALVNKDKETP